MGTIVVLTIMAVFEAIVRPVMLPVEVPMELAVLPSRHSVVVRRFMLVLETMVATIMLAVELIVLAIVPVVSVVTGRGRGRKCQDSRGKCGRSDKFAHADSPLFMQVNCLS